MISNIKRSTQLFAIAPLLLLIISKTLLILADSASQSFVWVAYVAEFIFLWHLIFENKKTDWLYSIVIGLLILGSIGDLFRIMHWPFGPIMFFGGLLGSMIMTCLFLYNSVKTTSKVVRYEMLMLSLCLIVQFAMAISILVLHGFWATYSKFLFYPIAALCGTVLLKNKYVNLGERNLTLYLLVHSLFIIIRLTFRLFA